MVMVGPVETSTEVKSKTTSPVFPVDPPRDAPQSIEMTFPENVAVTLDVISEVDRPLFLVTPVILDKFPPEKIKLKFETNRSSYRKMKSEP